MDIEPFIARLKTNPALAEAHDLVETYSNEARIALALIAPLLRPGMRVLEVGCGIGALVRFLRDHDFDVVGIEPGASGFGYMPRIASAILEREPALTIGAAQLDPATHGYFDLIYSTNVMEHVPDLAGAFKGLASVLAPGGSMVHLCPNYFIPYEPHFGIPLLPLAPNLTRFMFPRAIARYPGVWESLNFITARQVTTLARRSGLEVTFDRGVLSRTLRRFDEDEVFRQRQGRLVGTAQRLLSTLGLITLLDKAPGTLQTPMVWRLTHA